MKKTDLKNSSANHISSDMIVQFLTTVTFGRTHGNRMSRS